MGDDSFEALAEDCEGSKTEIIDPQGTTAVEGVEVGEGVILAFRLEAGVATVGEVVAGEKEAGELEICVGVGAGEEDAENFDVAVGRGVDCACCAKKC